MFNIKSLFGGNRKTVRMGGPAHEDVDLEGLGLASRPQAGARSKDQASRSTSKNGAKSGARKAGDIAKVEPTVDAGAEQPRGPAAIRLSDEEQGRILSGAAAQDDAGRDELLAQLDEVEYNLKKALEVVQQMQSVVATDYATLTNQEKEEACQFVNSLRGLVINSDQPAK